MSTKTLYIYCDGGARGNPGRAAIGGVIKNEKGETICSYAKYIGETTNNVAEYSALIEGLTQSKSYMTPGATLKVYMDSNLIVNQLKGNFKVKKPHLKQLHDRALLAASEAGGRVEYYYIPREKNTEADLLVNKALDAG